MLLATAMVSNCPVRRDDETNDFPCRTEVWGLLLYLARHLHCRCCPCDRYDALKVMYEDLEIAEVIGRGSSSFVLRARHVCTNKTLALKVRLDGQHKPAVENKIVG